MFTLHVWCVTIVHPCVYVLNGLLCSRRTRHVYVYIVVHSCVWIDCVVKGAVMRDCLLCVVNACVGDYE